MRHRQVGLWENERGAATEGFTLLSPLHTHQTYLVGMNGEVVHTWSHPHNPGNYAYLLKSGNLLWAGETPEGPAPGGGKGGLLREYDWDGNVVWEHRDNRQHHDFRRLANGNTIFIGWEPIPTEAASRVVGANPGSEDKDGTIWGDFLHEVTFDGKVVWEWHTHSDMQIENYPLHCMSGRKEFLHANAVTELSDGNLMLSFRRNSMIAIIDKKTRKIIWSHSDDAWGQQHDCEQLENGNILFFANGFNSPSSMHTSRVVELDPKNKDEVWSYKGSPPFSFYSPHISGAQRLWTGNTLICEGINGRIFEITPSGTIVWEFISPWFGDAKGGLSNEVFRAYRYAPNSPEIGGRFGASASAQ